MGFLHEAFHVQELTAPVEHPRKEGQGRPVVEGGDDVILVEGASVPGADQHEVLLRVESFQTDLAFKSVDVRGKVQLVGHDLRPCSRGLVEGAYQGVEVHRGGAGHDHFIGRCSHEGRHLPSRLFREMKPWRGSLEPAPYGQVPPFTESFLKGVSGSPGRQPKGVAVHVGRFRRNVELVPEGFQRIPPVHFLRPGPVRRESLVHSSSVLSFGSLFLE
ncbi:hypothetical protein SDC9_180832 [bioreactor metagenome]|uniref:Uncharacterized protein n=1 Tax=bioreactor metagenome TaxID=1076179 RepID=A0A645H4D0_9ZZZZ